MSLESVSGPWKPKPDSRINTIVTLYILYIYFCICDLVADYECFGYKDTAVIVIVFL